MTFKHKLSARLARLWVVLAVVGVACERLAAPTGPAPVVQIVILPESLTVAPAQQIQFAAYGRTSAGDSTGVAVTWSTSGGSIVGNGSYTADTASGDFLVTATSMQSNASGSSKVHVRKVATVAVSPAAASVGVGQTVQLTATPKDASGNPLTGRTITWASGNAALATVSANGLVTGVAAGLVTMTATSEGKNGTSVDSVLANAPPPPPPPPPGGNPNEPAGFQRFAENDFTVPMLDHTAPTGLLGLWRAEILDSDNTYVADAAAPKSPLPVFQGKYPAGWTAGYTPIKWEGWDGAANSLGYGTEMAQMYLSLWIRFPGADYENQSVGTKFFYLGVGESKASAGNQLYTMLYHPSGAGQTIASNFPVSMEQQSAVAGVNNRTEITAAPVFSIGAWHRMEFVLQLNTIGQANGVFRWWVDGTLVMDYRDMIYVDAANPLGFFTFKFWPYWGGGGGSKTRDDYVQVDHIYLSGIPK